MAYFNKLYLILAFIWYFHAGLSLVLFPILTNEHNLGVSCVVLFFTQQHKTGSQQLNNLFLISPKNLSSRNIILLLPKKSKEKQD